MSDGITGKLISAVWDPWENLPEYLDDLKKSDIYTLRRIVPEDRGKNWGNVDVKSCNYRLRLNWTKTRENT